MRAGRMQDRIEYAFRYRGVRQQRRIEGHHHVPFIIIGSQRAHAGHPGTDGGQDHHRSSNNQRVTLESNDAMRAHHGRGLVIHKLVSMSLA